MLHNILGTGLGEKLMQKQIWETALLLQSVGSEAVESFTAVSKVFIHPYARLSQAYLLITEIQEV